MAAIVGASDELVGYGEASASGAPDHISEPTSMIMRPGIDGAICARVGCPCVGRRVTAEHPAVRVSVSTRGGGGAKEIARLLAAGSLVLDCWIAPKSSAVLHASCWEEVLGEAGLRESSDTRTKRSGRGKAASSTSAKSSSSASRALHTREQSMLASTLETCDPERFDTVATARRQAAELAVLLRASKKAVAFTGAGVSVTAGIPTYRGTGGVDVVGFELAAADAAAASAASASTASAAAQPRPVKRVRSTSSSSSAAKEHRRADEKESLHGLSDVGELAEALRESETYTRLQVTPTHAALARLHQAGLLQSVITQNCDGLHRRSGLPRDALVTLHGDVFVEFCEDCHGEYDRPYCVDLYSTDCSSESWYRRCPSCSWNHYTGRRCDGSGIGARRDCRGQLRDTIVNFGDDLHETVLGGLPRAESACREADVIMALGSSMTVTPACDLPRLHKKGAAIVIVNLQETPLDSHAMVRIRAFFPTDGFFALLMDELKSVV